MAKDSFDTLMPHLFRHEGGFADHPRDPGGATKYGITRATLSSWRGRPVSRTDVRRLTQAEAAAIYRARYWTVVKADALPAGVDYCVFDAAVNSGPARAAKWLQATVRVTQDGVIGPKTLAAVKAADPARLVEDLCDIRLAFLRGLSTWSVFGRGWERRVEAVRAHARTMGMKTMRAGAPARPAADAMAGSGTPDGDRRIWSVLAAFLRALLTGGRR